MNPVLAAFGSMWAAGLTLASGLPQLPTISIVATTGTVREGGTNSVACTVSRTGDTAAPLRVEYLVEGNARNGTDYVGLTGVLNFPVGQSSAAITLSPIDNLFEEEDRSVTLTLTTNTRPFTLVVLPDTQYYMRWPEYYDLFLAQTRWVVDHRHDHNIAFVLHEGDCTDNNTLPEWERFTEGMRRLDGVVPYAVALGNHDGLNQGFSLTALFNQHFPVAKYRNLPTFGGVFESNRLDNCYHYFSAGGTDWLVLSLEFGPRDEVLAWANQVVASHPGRRVILVTHAHVYSDDTLHGSLQSHFWKPTDYGRANNGADVWDKLVRRHANFAFVFNGHVLNEMVGRVVGTGDHGNRVYQMLANYQFFPNWGNGFLRLIQFDPAQDKFSVKSFSPPQDAFLTSERQQFEYSGLGIFATNLTYQVNPASASVSVAIVDDDTDIVAPRILKAEARGIPPEIFLSFSERLETAPAIETANYEVDHGVVITGAVLQSNLTTVVLTTESLLTTGVSYTLAISRLRDRARHPNTIADRTPVPFNYRPLMLAADFDDDSLAGWRIVDEGLREGPSLWLVRHGRLEQTANIFGPDVYAQEHRLGTYAVWDHPGARFWSGYLLSATVTAQDDDGLGLLFRYQDASNYYKLELDTQRSFRKLLRVRGGEETLLAQEAGGYPLNQPVRLQVEARGGAITARLDDLALFGGAIMDGGLDRGTVALYTWANAGVAFDDVMVSAEGQFIPLPHDTNTSGGSFAAPTIFNLVPIDAEWTFWPFEEDPAPGWQQLDYDDGLWPGPGVAVFANDPDLAPDPIRTSLSLGPVAFHFRHVFRYTNGLGGLCLRLRSLVDDGAVFYLNGREILRLGMPAGPVGPGTVASRNIGNADYEGPFDVPGPNLNEGDNVLAVEVHQADPYSEDVVFGAELDAVMVPSLPVHFSQIRLASGSQVQLTLPGLAGRIYRVESSTDLRQWRALVARTNYYGVPLLINAETAGAPCRFFRASQVPLSCADQ